MRLDPIIFYVMNNKLQVSGPFETEAQAVKIMKLEECSVGIAI